MIFRRVTTMGFDFWAFMKTKVLLKVPKNGIVADVGSGQSPHFKSNLLIEKYPAEDGHRVSKVVRHRNQLLILADAHKLPIHDKSIAFMIASHVMEHVEFPITVCEEMSRVSNAGYVECPAKWAENLLPLECHSWFVSLDENQQLHFEAKRPSDQGTLPKDLTANRRIKALFRDRSLFTVQKNWEDKVTCTVDGIADPARLHAEIDPLRERGGAENRLVGIVSRVISLFVKPNRVSRAELIGCLRCSQCDGVLKDSPGFLHCVSCDSLFSSEDNVIDLREPAPAH